MTAAHVRRACRTATAAAPGPGTEVRQSRPWPSMPPEPMAILQHNDCSFMAPTARSAIGPPRRSANRRALTPPTCRCSAPLLKPWTAGDAAGRVSPPAPAHLGRAHVERQRDRRRDLAAHQCVHEVKSGHACSGSHVAAWLDQLITLERGALTLRAARSGRPAQSGRAVLSGRAARARSSGLIYRCRGRRRGGHRRRADLARQ
jgi:hypothetical protein